MGQFFFRRKDSEDEWTQLDMAEMRIDSARPVASSHVFDTGSYEVTLSGVEKDKLEEQVAHKIGGGTSQLSPLFALEMMGYPLAYLILPFLSPNGGKKA